jgi:hypothetical protein
MGRGLLGEDEGEDELDEGGEGEHAPELEDPADLLVISAGEEAEGEEDGQVEGEQFAAWGHGYFAKERSVEKKDID